MWPTPGQNILGISGIRLLGITFLFCQPSSVSKHWPTPGTLPKQYHFFLRLPPEGRDIIPFTVYTTSPMPVSWQTNAMQNTKFSKVHLQTDDVCVVLLYFIEYHFLAVVPAESPWRTVTIQLSCAVFVTQNIVAHDDKLHCKSHEILVNMVVNATLRHSLSTLSH